MRNVFYVKALESGLFREKDYVENAEYILERHKTFRNPCEAILREGSK
jgi:hypothetical protein